MKAADDMAVPKANPSSTDRIDLKARHVPALSVSATNAKIAKAGERRAADNLSHRIYHQVALDYPGARPGERNEGDIRTTHKTRERDGHGGGLRRKKLRLPVYCGRSRARTRYQRGYQSTAARLRSAV